MLNFHALRISATSFPAPERMRALLTSPVRILRPATSLCDMPGPLINLGKGNVDTWPTRDALPKIFAKYRGRLKISVWDPNGFIIIANLDPDLKVKDVLREFRVPTMEEALTDERIVQDKYRL